MDRKAYIIALYNILCEKSDPDHPLSESQIRHYLETEYDIKCGRTKCLKVKNTLTLRHLFLRSPIL